MSACEITYEHFVYTKTKNVVNKLAGVYQKAGYIADVHVDLKLVIVYTNCDPENEGDWNNSESVEKIAKENEAIYDGGGCYVGPMEKLS